MILSGAVFKSNTVGVYLRSGNYGMFYGGAVFMLYNSGTAYTWSASNCTFVRNSLVVTGTNTYPSSNTVVIGGAIGTWIGTGSLNVTGCSFTSNSATLTTTGMYSGYEAGGGRCPIHSLGFATNKPVTRHYTHAL